jgi:hypothetical protein
MFCVVLPIEPLVFLRWFCEGDGKLTMKVVVVSSSDSILGVPALQPLLSSLYIPQSARWFSCNESPSTGSQLCNFQRGSCSLQILRSGACIHLGSSNSTNAKAGGLGGVFKSKLTILPYCRVDKLVDKDKGCCDLWFKTRCLSPQSPQTNRKSVQTCQ